MPPATTLETDIACTRCGYNLRTLAVDACCPECGSTVRESLAMRPFAHLDPLILQRVAFGLLLAVLSPLFAGVVYCASVDQYDHEWPSLLMLFPGGDKGWLILLAFSQSRRTSIWVMMVAASSIAAHLLSSLLLTTPRLLLPAAVSVGRSYRAWSLASFAVISCTWFAHKNEPLFYVGIVILVISDLGQMILFIGRVHAIVRAGAFSDLEVSVGRQFYFVPLALLITGMGFSLHSIQIASFLAYIVLAIGLFPALVASFMILRLCWRLYRIRPR